MNKLDELIQELCPAGVEYKKIKEVYKRIKGTPITAAKMKEIADDNGDVKIFAGGKTIVYAFEKDIPNANITRIPAVLVQSRGVIDVVYYDLPFTFKNEMWAYTHENPITLKFLYYVLKNNINKFRDEAAGMGSMPQISLKVTEDFNMPVPPLEVQKEIVCLLDDFTAKTAELQDKLNEELEARKKQYEYYRDSLFSDKLNDLSLELCPNGVQYCELKEIADISTGSHNTNEGVENGMYPFYVRSQEPLTLNSYDYDETAIITAGDGVGVGKVFHFVNGKYALHQRAYRIHANTTKVEDKFLYYYFCTNFMKYIEKTMFKGSVPSIRRPMLNAFKIPVPPLEIQQEIVRLLDDFTAKTTKLQDNLNEELEACKKQYEFYRDKLLTFKELNESEVN